MIAVTVQGTDAMIARLNGAGEELRRELARNVARAGLIVRQELTERMSDPGGSHPLWGRTGGAGDRLAARSGHSRARISPGTEVFRVGDMAFVVVGSPDKHIAHLEEGGTITGRPYLRIPTVHAQTAQGVDRWAGRSIRDIPGAFLFRSRANNLWAAMRQGARGALRLLYLLKPSVTIRGRHVFREAQKAAQPEIERNFQGAVSAVVRRANGTA